MEIKELRNQRRDADAAHGHAGAHVQMPLSFRMEAASELRGVVELRQNAPDVLQVEGARLRQANLPARLDEKLKTELLFQAVDASGNCRRRDAKFPRCGGETPGSGSLDEQSEAVKRVHMFLPGPGSGVVRV